MPQRIVSARFACLKRRLLRRKCSAEQTSRLVEFARRLGGLVLLPSEQAVTAYRVGRAECTVYSACQ